MSNEVQKPIRVLFFEPYPMGYGGNFLTQQMILKRLDRRNFAPLVVAPIEGVALDRFRAMGVECVVISPPGILGRYGGVILQTGLLGRLKSALDLLLYNLRLARFFRKKDIDVVYANCVRAQLSAGFGAWLANVPTLLYIKGELANPTLDRLCFFLASRILFFCTHNRDDRYPYLVRWFAHKISILRIGMDPALLSAVAGRDQSALRQELGISSDFVNVAVMGQLYRPKGQHFAIEALSRLIAEFPNIRLYLVGDHVIEEYRPYRAELEALIKNHGLLNHVFFTGWRMDALDVASQMDIILHPSLAEGFGRAVLESMALGKPVIASAVGGLREAVQDGRNGYLVAPGNVEAIVSRWRELLSSPELRQRLGQEARRTVFADYLIDDKVTQLAEIWTEMAAGRS
jgi:glycosyltransferase involved in cell wall biosynthesis